MRLQVEVERCEKDREQQSKESYDIGQRRANDPQEAQRVAEEMAKQDPRNADVRLFLGKLQAQQGKLPAAQDLFDEAIKLNPDHKWAYVNKAGAQAQRGDLPNALATTQALTNRFPDSA